MIAEMSLAARTLAVIGIVLWPSAVLGQAPSSDGDVWYPTGLSFDRCMQRGEAALRAMGSVDAYQFYRNGMDWWHDRRLQLQNCLYYGEGCYRLQCCRSRCGRGA